MRSEVRSASEGTAPRPPCYALPMSTAVFDTYAAAKRLRDAGFDEVQAEAAVSMVRDATAADRERLATKADLAALRTDLAALETRMLKFGIGLAFAIVFANVSLTVALVKLL